MRNRYYVGHCVKGISLFANVVVIFEQDNSGLKQYNNVMIEITFEKDFNFRELKEQGIELPYYTKGKKYTWTFKIEHKDQLIPELNRLDKNGFKIMDIKQNPEIHRLIATLI